jgi:predicted metal-binding protein
VENKCAIEKTEVGWSKSVVMICQRCGEQFQSSFDKVSPERIKSELKSSVKAKNLGDEVRVITTSCLNMCPKERIAIAIAEEGRHFVGLSVDNKTSGDELFDQLISSKKALF